MPEQKDEDRFMVDRFTLDKVEDGDGPTLAELAEQQRRKDVEAKIDAALASAGATRKKI